MHHLRHEEDPCELLDVRVGPGGVPDEPLHDSLLVLHEEGGDRARLLVTTEQLRVEGPLPQTDRRDVVPEIKYIPNYTACRSNMPVGLTSYSLTCP
jgi:hypothetical protein